MHASVIADGVNPPAGGTIASADNESVATDLGVLMKHLLVSSSRDFFAAVEQAGLTFTQVKCLYMLGDAEEPLPLSRLSEVLGLSGPAISRAVDGLVQRSEVKRTEDPRDRRSKLLKLSARGRRTLERFTALRFAGVKRFVEGLTDEERHSLAAGVGPIARRLNS
jgi:MarR family transcriptional regulator for hemolysin